MGDFDHTDAQDFALWLRLVKEAFLDLERAALDQTRAPAQRELGRASARQIIDESAWALEQLIEAATCSVGHGDPAGAGGAGDVN